MSPVKIVFFDLDGTLLDRQVRRFSEETVYAIEQLQKNGIKCCLVTGRPPACLPKNMPLHFDVLSTFNGSLCYTDSQVIYSNPIDPADVRTVLANAAALGRPVSVAVRDRQVANGYDLDLADYCRLAEQELTVSPDFEETCREDVYQIMLGSREEEYSAIIRNADRVKIAVSWERAVDVIPSTGGKGTAIGHILAFFGFSPREAIAFGDGQNDLEMFHAVGTGIAMGNASDKIKAEAHQVCGSVTRDGVYHYCVEQGLIPPKAF